MSKLLVLVRIRGRTHVKEGIDYTMTLLGLTRKNHCVLFNETPENKGMIQKVKDYLTWGEIDAETLKALVEKRGKLKGGKPITDEYLKNNTNYKNIQELVNALASGQESMSKVEGVKKVFRLNPPIKGFERKGIKKPVSTGGALGYRGDKINDLIKRMI